MQLQHSLFLTTKFPKPLSPLCFFTTMAATTSSNSDQAEPTTKPTSQITLQTLENYPVPLSHPPPPISKDMELCRAVSAKSKSLFGLSRPDVIFQDQWLVVVNKPQGVYCERVLESIPQVLCHSDESGESFGLGDGVFG